MKDIKKALKNDLWVLLLDLVSVNFAYYLALVLRSLIDRVSGSQTSPLGYFFNTFYKFAPWYTVACIIIFAAFKLYNGLWRYAGIDDMNRIIGASAVSTAVQVAGTLLFFHRMPITYYMLGAAFQFVLISLPRFMYRFFIMEKRRNNKKTGNALVVGVREPGVQIMRMVQEGLSFRVVCMVDPDNNSDGKQIDGIKVYGKDELVDVLKRHAIKCVFLAEPELNNESRERIKAICDERHIFYRDHSSFFDFSSESDQFTGMEDVVKGPEQNCLRRIPFSPPDISESEIGEVVEALKSGWITTGPRTKLLERRLAAYIETGKTDVDTEGDQARWNNRVVCLNSATAAEELNLRILGIGPGDEVIVPAYTYTASASAAIHCGATVKFVDIQKDGDAATHCPEMDYEALEAAITPKTKAIVPVDLGGIVCDYDRIFEIVERNKHLFRPMNDSSTPLAILSSRIQKGIGRVAIVCDAAHALGASRTVGGEKKYVGAIADFTSFSFHAVKNFTTAEGGASAWNPVKDVDNAEIYKMYQLLSLHGQNKDALAKTRIGAWEYDIIGPWYKCNMTDIMAAIGLRQLDRYLGLLERRVAIINKYNAVCDELGISHLEHHTESMDSSNHLFLIRIPGIDEQQRNKIIEKMAERGVATNVHYKPLPLMTAYGTDCSAYPNAYDYYHNLITLPLHTRLSDEDVDYVCETLREVMKSFS